MLENFIYETNFGQRFTGLENGVYLNYNDLRDYSWSYEQINSRISRFYKGVTNRKLPLVIYGDTEEKALAVKNRLLEMAETDIEAMLPGRVYVGEYYTKGFITASAKSNYLINKRLCNIDLTLTCDDPSWYREQVRSFAAGSDSAISAGSGTDYPYDYPYDYALKLQGRNVVNDAISRSAFRLTIYGKAENPAVNIGDHTYMVKGVVSAGEVLTIDSLAKTITLTTASGQNINWFDKRNREQYIFEPIPAGKNPVTWSGDFGFDLTIIEKRSEPRWT